MGTFARSKLLSAGAVALLALSPADAFAAKKKKSGGSSTTQRAQTRAGETAQPAAANARGAMTPAMKQTVPEIPTELTELPLAAKGAIVIDALTGQTLYEKNADVAQFPASTTKIMTALLVIEEGNLDKEVEVTEDDSKVGESGLDIKPGELYTRREMLYGLLLKSANDVAHALGRDNAGSIEAFAEKMTRRAHELGATNTHFMNPHGLHNIQHYTSPRDLALIARAAMQQPMFRQVVSTWKHGWISPSYGPRELTNHNRLLAQFPGCTGVKTGYTNPAQQVLASAALWGCREVIATVMHTDKPGIWDDSKLLLTWGLERPPGSEQSQEPPSAVTSAPVTAAQSARAIQ